MIKRGIESTEARGTTGRYIVTFHEGATEQALNALINATGISSSQVARSSEFGLRGIRSDDVPTDGALVLEHIGVAIMDAPPQTGAMLELAADDASPILAVEPEGYMYVLQDEHGPSSDYLRGFRDAADSIFSRGPAHLPGHAPTTGNGVSLSQEAWGLNATGVTKSKFTGKGIRVAILDTGLDFEHPDFVGRKITSKSFVAGVGSAQDGHGHGTHCTGTACGPLRPGQGPRYGIAHGSEIYVGKVLSDEGRGKDFWILAGMDWAVANRCQVISMSLGANVATTSVAYEAAGHRALTQGSLVIAAAGNNARRLSGNFGYVGRPANSRTIMAVGAVDSALAVADFSARDTAQTPGTAVDIAGPGVSVLSAWLMPQRSNTISGTSMATPHVAGIAALWSEATGLTGAKLWQRLVSRARSLPKPATDVGQGLVQAP